MRMFSAVLTCLIALAPADATSQVGCWDATNHLPPSFDSTTITVYARDSFYDHAIGTLTATQRERAVRQLLAKFKAESGSTIHLEWGGRDDTKTCSTPGEPDIAAPRIVLTMQPGAHPNGFSAFGHWAIRTTGFYNCGRIVYYATPLSSFSKSRFQALTLHELGHTLGVDHAEECPATATHVRGCWYDSWGCCENTATGGPCDGTELEADRRYLPYLARPDRHYLREDVGTSGATFREDYGDGMPPPSNGWVGATWAAGEVLSAGAGTDGDIGPESGYIWNRENSGNGDYETRALLYESGSTTTTPSSWDSYYKPDIARSVGQATDRWMAVFYARDSLTNDSKDVRIAERAFGASSWSWSWLDVDETLPHIALSYDPVTDRFVMVRENPAGLVFSTRPRTGGAWFSSQTTIPTFDGADIACSQHGGPFADNCILSYVDAADSPVARWRRFQVFATGVVAVELTERSTGLVGFTRPSLTVNPLNEDPQFVLGLSQAGQTVYLRKLDRLAYSWVSGGSFAVGQAGWLPPAGLGSWLSSIMDLVANF